MKQILAILAMALLTSVYAGEQSQLVAKDSNGMLIEIKEKYGGTVIDWETSMANNFLRIGEFSEGGYFPSSP